MIIALSLVLSVAGCKEQAPQSAQPKPKPAPPAAEQITQTEPKTQPKVETPAPKPVAPAAVADQGPVVGSKVLIETSFGDIVIGLYEQDAPITTKNFLGYVQSGFYNGTIFHRVISGFMIQGGGFTQEFQKKPTRAPIINETYNKVRNKRGTIAMARTNDMNSATCQFFINHKDNKALDYDGPNGGYAVFGTVLSGMDVVDAIAAVQTGLKNRMRDVPVENVVIESITVTK